MTAACFNELEAKVIALESILDRLRWKLQCPTCRNLYDDSISSLKPSEAIISCLREYDRPIGVRTLRDKLEAKGYPMNRFGWQYRYFYTLLCRLDESGKIERVDGDEVMLKG